MTRRRTRGSVDEWTVGAAQSSMFDTGGADQGALFDREPARAAAGSHPCVTCGSETTGDDRCPRCVALGATAPELLDER